MTSKATLGALPFIGPWVRKTSNGNSERERSCDSDTWRRILSNTQERDVELDGKSIVPLGLWIHPDNSLNGLEHQL
jgi:hypothetical protein